MIRYFATILLTILISAFQAYAQSLEADIFSQFIVTCGVDSATKKTEKNDLASVLSFVESTVSDSTLLSKKTLPEKKNKTTGIDVLDVISNAYAGHNYYSTGAWGAEPPFYPGTVQPPVSGIPFPLLINHCISSDFGYRDQFNRMHSGIDIAMCVGDTVRAPMPGVVSKVSIDKGYGKFIVLLHDNGLESRYAHLSETLVAIGQRIKTGEPIGQSGNTGNSTGPHLHLEIRYRGIPLDPKFVFDFKKSK